MAGNGEQAAGSGTGHEPIAGDSAPGGLPAVEPGSPAGQSPGAKPKGHTAVMASRHEPPDSLDFFPTPPWATRALLEHVLPVDRFAGSFVGTTTNTCWEPAAGEGHMASVLGEYFAGVWRSDVFDYGGLNACGSFVGEGADVAQCPRTPPDWVITNPPFNLGKEFVLRALATARVGVAVLVRSAWLEGVDRYSSLFGPMPPEIVAPFVERVPMVRGRWDPDASTATAYSWVVWARNRAGGWSGDSRMRWIPPGCRKALERPDDRARFAPQPEAGGLL